MKITKKVVAATLVPAAVAGIAVSSLAAVHAAPGRPPGHFEAAEAHRQALTVRLAARAEATRDAHGRVAQASRRRDHARLAAEVAADRQADARAADRRVDARARKAHTARSRTASQSSMFAGMSAFERCVAWRESGDNPTASSAGLFGILPSTWASLGYPGTAGQASVAMQKAAFTKLYSIYGTSPWAPYDGC